MPENVKMKSDPFNKECEMDASSSLYSSVEWAFIYAHSTPPTWHGAGLTWK